MKDMYGAEIWEHDLLKDEKRLVYTRWFTLMVHSSF